MSYAVSITASGGMLRVTVTGEPSGNNFTRSYKPQSVMLNREEGSSVASLVEIESGQTIWSFAYADVTAPSLGMAGNIGTLYTAIEALLGAGETPGLPSGAATSALQDDGNASLASIDGLTADAVAALGNIQNALTPGGLAVDFATNAKIDEVKTLLSQMLSSIVETTLLGGTVVTPAAVPAGSWTSRTFTVPNFKTITLQMSVANSGISTGTVKFQGTNNISGVWQDIGSPSAALGDGDMAPLVYNSTSGAFAYIRVVFNSTDTVQECSPALVVSR